MACIVALGVAPDLDLLWGRHSRETHSVGAAVIVAAVAAWRRWPLGPSGRAGIFATACAAWLSHPLLDVHAIDDAVPIGVMLLWPVSDGFVHAPWAFFDPISRHFSQPSVWVHNFAAAGREILRLAPIAAMVWVWRRPKN